MASSVVAHPPQALAQQQPKQKIESEDAALVTLSAEAELQAKIAALIEVLGDDNYHRRVDAKWELERIGLAAFEQLRQAAQAHPNAHVARAARYLIESQDVVWWLESDSLEVRELLKNYNEIKNEDRDTVLQQLSERGTPDALLALCRLARFESNELRSKSAALYLMQAITEHLDNALDSSGPDTAKRLPASIELTLGDSGRPSALWLLGLMDDLRFMQSPEATAPDAPQAFGTERIRPPAGHLQRWRQLIAQEHALVSVEAQASSLPFKQFRALAVTLRFYRWLGSWVTQNYGRGEALELVRSSLQLVGKNPHSLLTAAAWALDADLPELVPELAEASSAEFAAEPQLGYYLAESHLRLHDQTAAEQAAEAASQSVAKQLENLKNLPNLNIEEIQANRHYQHARLLAQRGLIQWAENEYLRALSFESKVQAGIRADLAQFYWFGGENEKAAEALRPLAEEATKNQAIELPNSPDVFSDPGTTLANFYFYSGLAALDRNEIAAASDNLRKALQIDSVSPNPDVVIAMQRIATAEPYSSYFHENFEKMSSEFRIRVFEAEEQLSRAADRMSRAMAAPRLAEECNQLAWLLSKCQTSPKEALSLSLRSLELMHNEPVYMDTLGRCYFAAGQLKDAVRVQRQAVKLAPHERQMATQLKEFEAALEAEQASIGAGVDE